MASQAHAFFCFEVLAAAFDNEEHLGLQKILDLYETPHNQPSLETQGPNSTQTQSDGATNEEDHISPQLPSISRLQAGDFNSRSTGSTPSTRSVNSSTSQLTDSTATSITTHSTNTSRSQVIESYPLFVTWNVVSRSGYKSLRGCIGTFEALPLEKGLKQYALTSAFEDTRFAPIPAPQLPKLSCSLTLLADFEESSGPLDWVLGVHGIRISFTHRYRKHGATYLPDVAVEQGWSKEETLESLMRKAGWEPASRKGSNTSSQPWEEVESFKLVRYTGLKASASYGEWQEWRNLHGLS